jgi:hypothetical protein
MHRRQKRGSMGAMRSGRCFPGLSLLLVMLTAGCEDAAGGNSDPSNNEAGASDAASEGGSDAGSQPTGDAEAGASDAGDGCVPFVMPTDCTIPENSALPSDLRCTGLYGRFEQRELACNVLGYAPAYALWSDGADKHRYVWLPAGGKLDASDPNDLVFPIGTKFWKEFRLPNGGRLLETRLLQKVDNGWVYTSYVWSEDEKSATQNNDGVDNLLGTGHVVPNRDQCDECHRGRKDKILGWDALLLGAGARDLTRDELVRRGLFEPGKELPSLSIPGDEVERAALGYLHVNCGVSCHNPNPRAKGGNSGLSLRLEADMLSSAAASPAVTTGLHRVPSTNSKYGGISVPDGTTALEYFRDFVPLNLERSLILVRMKTRGDDGEMPSIGSKQVDQAGVEAVSRWIQQMNAERGYPQDAGDAGL